MTNPQWYKEIWSLGIKDQSWVEDTARQVGFLVRTLGLRGGEKILDLACGFGRHALALAEMGFSVVGADITKDYIEDARHEAARRGLRAEFVHEDIRNLAYEDEFDVVLNMADGAIGYLEDDRENLKIFDVISRALKKGGRHFMDVCNAEHAETRFPKRHWEFGSKSLSLPEFKWDPASRRMLYSQMEFEIGKVLPKPDAEPFETSTRLYSKLELSDILAERGMRIIDTFCDFDGNKDSPKELQLLVYSRKDS